MPPRCIRPDTLFTYTTLYRSISIHTGISPQLFRPPFAANTPPLLLGVFRRGVSRRSACVYSSQPPPRSEEHTPEPQSLMRISYAVFCLKHKHNMIILSPPQGRRTDAQSKRT